MRLLSNKACSSNCHICGNGELSPNGAFFAGRCNSESDLGSGEDVCPWEDTNYCLKLKITFDPDLRRRTEFIENNLFDDEMLNNFPKQERDEMSRFLSQREC